MTDTITSLTAATVTLDQDCLWESLGTLSQTGPYDDAATLLASAARA